MWLPFKVAEKNYPEMQAMGVTVPAAQIYNEEAPSLEDAIIRLDGGSCTAELISGSGLMLTNHHCAYDAIASLSSEANDLLTTGFWAANHGEELPIEGSTAAMLIHSEDVTAKVMELGGENPMEQQNAFQQIAAEATEGTEYDAVVKEMFEGLEYHLFVYEVYRDVRLVGAPPSSVGKFGFDTDNWMWPRHTGDFALLRIYAGPDGKPAEYAPENKPLEPKYHLPISLAGVEEGDYTMIMGYPGSTDRYLTAAAVEMALNRSNEDRITLMGIKAKLMKAAMDKSDAVRIALASSYASLMNSYKYYQGQTTMMKRYDVPGQKRQEEAAFQAWAEADSNRNEKYGDLLEEIRSLHEGYYATDQYVNYLTYGLLIGAKSTNNVYMNLGGFSSLLEEGETEEIEGAVSEIKAESEGFYKSFYPQLDEEIFAGLAQAFYDNLPADMRPEIFEEMTSAPAEMEEAETMAEDTGKKKKKKKKKKRKSKDVVIEPMPAPVPDLSPEEYLREWVRDAYANSVLTDKDRFYDFLELAQSEPAEAAEAYDADPIVRYVRSAIDLYRGKVMFTDLTYDMRLGKLRKTYLEGLMEMHEDKLFYPDANSTLRLTYGKVRSYEPRDGVSYHYYTTLKGVMEKEDPTDEEFLVPDKLKQLWRAEDYGRYAAEDGDLRLCFLSTNDITGGNSGSPVLNAKGELIGCAFDGNWESMSSDIHIFPQFNRTISVDIRYVLFIIDKFANAGHLIEEMTIME